MKKIVVTGGLGFIGHHLITKLLQEDEDIKLTIIDNLSNVNQKFLNSISNDNRNLFKAQDRYSVQFGKTSISVIKQDIRNRETIFDIFKQGQFDVCIHLAAKVSVVESVKDPNDTVAANIGGTFNVLDACAENKVGNIVFASTGAVYGEPKILPISEDHILEPLSPYGASKIAGEMLLASYVHSSKIRSGIALRFFNVYGEGQTAQYAGVITSFVNRLSVGLPPIIYGDGAQTRDFIFVGDIVKGIIKAANSNERVPGYNVFNLATGKSTSIYDLAKMMIRAYGYDGNMEPLYEPERKGDIKAALVDVSRSERILGFKADTTLQAGLEQIILPSIIPSTDPTTTTTPKLKRVSSREKK